MARCVWGTHFFQTHFFSPSPSGLCVGLFLRLFEEFCPVVATVGRLEGRRKGRDQDVPSPICFSQGIASMAPTSAVFSPLIPRFQLAEESCVTGLTSQQLWFLGYGNTLSPRPPLFLRAVQASQNASSCTAWVLFFSICSAHNRVV